ncbi:MAG: ABC transporter substrate-binding protein [Acidobacteria bacterium]|nr:ABC transporter substrate-binding protein [Acidobacteriota bacterium]
MPSLHSQASRSAGACALLLIALLSSGSCSSIDEASSRHQDPVLRIGVGIGNSLKDSGVMNLTYLFYAEPLFNRELDGRLTPRLANSWAWEQGGHSLRIRLKPGVVLHDGTPMTAELVAGQLRSRVPEQGKEAAWGFNFVTRISATDADTVLIELSQPDMFLLTALSDLRIVHPTRSDVATGPFSLVARTPQVEATRFDRYHDGRSALAGIRIITYETHRSAWAALMREEVDVVQEVNRESVEFMENSSRIRNYSSLQPFYVPLVFNVAHPILGKVDVRRALVQAINPGEVLTRLMRGQGRVAQGPIWPLHWAYEETVKQEFSPGAARAGLDRSGYPQPKPTRAGELRARFRVRCLVNSEDPQDERIALMVQRQLFDVGVHLEIELLPMDDLIGRIRDGNFETYMVRANGSRTLERTYRFWRSPGPLNIATQNSGYTGADALLDQLRRSISDDEVRAAVRALAARFHEDAPAAFIAWLEITRAVDAKFDVGVTAGEDPFTNIWRWKLAGQPQ